MKIKYVCKNCGSDSVGRDAFVDWNYETQKWELANFANEHEGFCFQCSDETELTEIEMHDEAV
jgi:ribosomal protein L37AE/L43A